MVRPLFFKDLFIALKGRVTQRDETKSSIWCFIPEIDAVAGAKKHRSQKPKIPYKPMQAQGQSTWTTFDRLFLGALAGSWIRSKAAETQTSTVIQQASVASSHLIYCSRMRAPGYLFFKFKKADFWQIGAE